MDTFSKRSLNVSPGPTICTVRGTRTRGAFLATTSTNMLKVILPGYCHTARPSHTCCPVLQDLKNFEHIECTSVQCTWPKMASMAASTAAKCVACHRCVEIRGWRMNRKINNKSWIDEKWSSDKRTLFSFGLGKSGDSVNLLINCSGLISH